MSAYDVSHHASPYAPAALAAGAGPAGSPFTLAVGGATTRAGDSVVLPLTLRPLGRPTGGLGDAVTLAARGQVGQTSLAGLAGIPSVSVSPANLFAQPSGGLSVQVQVPAGTTPGTYHLTVTATQGGATRRVARAVAVVVVRAGAPSAIVLHTGRAGARPDGLRAVTLTARVVDSSGAAVPDGTLVSFDTPAAALQPPTARTVGGVARTTLAYVPGDRPIVTANAAAAQTQLYVGPPPTGASTDLYFNASTGRAALPATAVLPAVPATGERLVLSNPLDAPARATLNLAVTTGARGGLVRHTALAVSVPAHGTVTQALTGDALQAVGSQLVGVEVVSDLPLLSRREVWQGTLRHTIGRTAGVDAPRAAVRLTLPAGHAVVDLYNLGARALRVSLTARRAGARAGVTIHTILPAGTLARVDLGAPIAARLRAGRGPLTVEVRGDGPLVAEAEAAPSLASQLTPRAATLTLGFGGPKVRGLGLVSRVLTVRVTTAFGRLAPDGTLVTFSAARGTAAAFDPPAARTVGGVARATLLDIASAHRIVRAAALGGATLRYVGPLPAGASTDRYFAASTGHPAGGRTRDHATTPAVSEQLVLRNLLDVPSQARLQFTVTIAGHRTVIRRRTLLVTVAAHGALTQPLTASAAGTVGTAGAADTALVGVEVRSDLPLISQRQARQAGGSTRAAAGAISGTDTLRAAYRLAPRAGHTVVDLYNPGGRATTVILTAEPGRARNASLRLTLLPGASARADVSGLLTRTRGGVRTTVTLRASSPVVAEVDPEMGLTLTPAAAPTYKTPAAHHKPAAPARRGGRR